MEKFVYKNKLGKTITIDYAGNYMLDSYGGLTASEILPITTTGYKQNGSTFISTNLGIRIISIKFGVFAGDALDMYTARRKIVSVFNPLLGEGTLTYTNDFISKSINVVVTEAPTPDKKYGTIQYYTVELTANNPLWFDNAESAIKLGDYTGGLSFPLQFEEDGVIYAQKGDIANITIEGDVPSPIRAEFKNASVNPKLELINTGEFIKVETSIDEGESLIINTEYGKKTVNKVNLDSSIESAFHLISPDSNFFSLPIGRNILGFSGDAGTPEVYVYYRNYYIGV
jgi:hypothetical protein